MGKMIFTASKTYFGIVVPQLDGGVFPTFEAKPQRIEKTESVSKQSKQTVFR